MMNREMVCRFLFHFAETLMNCETCLLRKPCRDYALRTGDCSRRRQPSPYGQRASVRLCSNWIFFGPLKHGCNSRHFKQIHPNILCANCAFHFFVMNFRRLTTFIIILQTFHVIFSSTLILIKYI